MKVYPECWVAVYRVMDESEAARPHETNQLFASMLIRFPISQPPTTR
jgi:hypothetical protein